MTEPEIDSYIKRTRKRVIAALIIALTGLVIAIGSLIYALHHHRTIALEPCNKGSAPCIQLADNDGKPLQPAIKFNDFRFGPQGCIYYLAPSDSKWHEHCGGYEMLWIGPGQPPGVRAKI
ncbi:MAG TPA: hypothetical protein VH234_05665 [Candidatus Saccharimonadales bacterium]|nr:hypothetical protein [Candidatus Saccharimonadales bacterium]